MDQGCLCVINACIKRRMRVERLADVIPPLQNPLADAIMRILTVQNKVVFPSPIKGPRKEKTPIQYHPPRRALGIANKGRTPATSWQHSFETTATRGWCFELHVKTLAHRNGVAV